MNYFTAASPASGVLVSGTSTDIAITGSVLSTFTRGVYSTSPADYITVAGVNARTCTTASVDVSASPNTAEAGNL